MQAYYLNFPGTNLPGVAIVVGETKLKALGMAKKLLVEQGLGYASAKINEDHLVEIDISKPNGTIIYDGEY